MRNDSNDTTRLRRAVTLLLVVGAIVLAAVVAARCSEPSKVVEGTADGITLEDATASTNAAATAQAVLTDWAGQTVELVGVRWLDRNTAVVTGSLAAGEHVAITVIRSEDGWRAPWSPAAVPAAPTSKPQTFAEVPQKAAGDEMWETAVGFLGAWLAGEDPWRWTAVGYRPEPPAVPYQQWTITGAGEPMLVPGALIAVIPIDYEAASAGSVPRPYRAWVAVSEDSDGQIGVTALAHRPPPQPVQ